MKTTQSSETQMKVRVPCQLHVWLKVQAALNRRTVTQEVAFRLEQARAAEDAAVQRKEVTQ